MEVEVSVVIPAKNSARTIEHCLTSITEQSYKNVETIIAFTKGSDSTEEILRRLKCNTVATDSGILGARYEGFKKSSGKYILMLDSDQVLERDTIERSLLLFKNYDLICLEEISFKPRSLIEKMFEADRRLIHDNIDVQIDPIYGTLHARFYKRQVLARAFEQIPGSLFSFVSDREDAIINYEARRVSDKVSILSNAVWHHEVSSLTELWKKNFIYGRSTKKLKNEGYYGELLKSKIHTRRTNSKKISKDKFLSILLLSLKAPAFFIGAHL